MSIAKQAKILMQQCNIGQTHVTTEDELQVIIFLGVFTPKK